ncbi:hypothetical protein [Streptomyces sp. NPDC046909]|uniref:hypothetical protein n=1 Tax=Streptomyces sp. NPDC046909 TaxID=3155617 RepID=UPI0033F22A2B
MHEILMVMAVGVLVAGVLIGLAAVLNGWLIPGPGRAKVLRPRMWGYGTLTHTAGVGTFLFLGPLAGPGSDYFRYAIAGVAVSFLGLYVQHLSMKSAS